MKQGSYPSWLGASLCASVLLGCGNTGAPPLTYEVDGKPVLTTLTEQVIVPEHQAFASAGDALVVAVQALADGPNAASLARAQTAWRDARKAYRHLDALHFGPGYSLHIGERIDVAPVDAAGVDALINGGAAVDDAAVANAAGKRKGFLGLEYLLFAAPEASDSDPVLVDDAAAPRRRALALSMADEIAKSAHQLDEAWDPDQGGFVTQLQLAGAGSTAYPTQRAAVDALVGGIDDALEIVVGRRLAPPLGNQTGGGGVPAPELDPTRRSDSAVADLQASLEGALALYSDLGLAGVVEQKSHELNRVVNAEFSEAQSSLAAIPAPFADSVANQTALVQAAYDATKALKKTWNTDVASALGATVKVSDTDGD